MPNLEDLSQRRSITDIVSSLTQFDSKKKKKKDKEEERDSFLTPFSYLKDLFEDTPLKSKSIENNFENNQLFLYKDISIKNYLSEKIYEKNIYLNNKIIKFNKNYLIDDLEDRLMTNQLNPYHIELDTDSRPAVELTPTEYVELSQIYAKRIANMQKDITFKELQRTTSLLRLSPLLHAILMSSAVLKDKEQVPSKQLLEKMRQLQSKYVQTTNPNTPIGQLLSQDISRTRTAIFDPTSQSVLELNEILTKSAACTATRTLDRENLEEMLKGSNAEAFVKDCVEGGSVHFEVLDRTNGNSYNRLYLGVSTEGKPVLFHDVIESGDKTLRTIGDYLETGKGNRLLSSFVSDIVIANRLGLEFVAFGDDEVASIARELGFGERKLFPKNTSDVCTHKLGFKAGGFCYSGIKAPYAWRINRHDTNFRGFDPRLYDSQIVQTVIDETYQVMQNAELTPKRLKSIKTELNCYFGFIEEMMSNTTHEKYSKLRLDIDNFYSKYNITPTSITQVNKEIELEERLVA